MTSGKCHTPNKNPIMKIVEKPTQISKINAIKNSIFTNKNILNYSFLIKIYTKIFFGTFFFSIIDKCMYKFSV